MIDALLWIVVGIVVGWHFPQPTWAKSIEDRIRGWFGL